MSVTWLQAAIQYLTPYFRNAPEPPIPPRAVLVASLKLSRWQRVLLAARLGEEAARLLKLQAKQLDFSRVAERGADRSRGLEGRLEEIGRGLQATSRAIEAG